LRIGHHVDPRCALLTSHPLRVFNESAPDAGAHPIRLDEEAVELTGITGALEQNGEADDYTGLDSDSHKTGRDLLRGQLDGIRMSGKLRPVHRLVPRRTALELFQRVPFRHLRVPDRRH